MDFARDAGLEYAKILPAAIGLSVAVLVCLAWLGWKTEDLEESWKGPARFGLAVFALLVIVQLPASYSSAKDYCRTEWANAGGANSPFPVPYAYTQTKCMSIWPQGPDH